MMPRHHPPESLWTDYATGGLAPTLRIMLEAHLDLCDACAATVAELSGPGGALLRGVKPEAPPADLFDRILARLPEPSVAVQAAPDPIPERLPRSLRPWLRGFKAEAWKGVLKAGVRFLEVASDEAAGVNLYLVHLAAGKMFPRHAHAGAEQALILAGGAQDGDLVLEAGDWAAYEPHTAHNPSALPDEDCWLLVRLEADIRFTGWRRLLQKGG